LHDWGVVYGSDESDTAALLVAELAANAVTHARVPGGFSVLGLRFDGHVVRIEVSDACGGWSPRPGVGERARGDAESEAGRGLLLVEASADRWAVVDRGADGKTVWAELDVAG